MPLAPMCLIAADSSTPELLALLVDEGHSDDVAAYLAGRWSDFGRVSKKLALRLQVGWGWAADRGWQAHQLVSMWCVLSTVRREYVNIASSKQAQDASSSPDTYSSLQ